MNTESTEIAERKVNRQVADTIQVGKGGITFENAAQVMEYAKMMAASGSAVKPFLRGSPGACLGIIDDAIRLRANPYALARKAYFVNDQLAYEAAVIMAIVNTTPLLKDRPELRFEGEGAERRCIVTGVFRSGAVREYRSPRFADISPKNSPLWKSDPDQQHSYYSLRAFGRRFLPEAILGIYDVDELSEILDLNAAPSTPPSIADGMKTIANTLEEFAAGTASPDTEASGEPVADADDIQSKDAPQASAGATPLLAEAPAASNHKEAIAKLLALASDPELTIETRVEVLNDQRPIWLQQIDSPEFVTTLIDTCIKVAKGELTGAAAKRYLGGLR